MGVVVGVDGCHERIELVQVVCAAVLAAKVDHVHGHSVLLQLLANGRQVRGAGLHGAAHKEHDPLALILVGAILERQLSDLESGQDVARACAPQGL